MSNFYGQEGTPDPRFVALAESLHQFMECIADCAASCIVLSPEDEQAVKELIESAHGNL